MSLAGRALGVVVLGPAGVELHGDGPLDAAASFHRELGGEGSLAAVVVARAGATTALVTHVGDDPFGRWLIERWEREGIHLDFTREVSRPSTLEVVGTDRRRFAPLPVSQSASATLAPAAVSAIPWELARVLLVTGAAQAAGPEARAAVARAASQAHAAGVRVVYDPTLSTDLRPTTSNRAPRWALEELIPALDTLALSAPYGAGRLLGQPAPEEAAKAALALGVGRVVVREAAPPHPPGDPENQGQGGGEPPTTFPRGDRDAPPGLWCGVGVRARDPPTPRPRGPGGSGPGRTRPGDRLHGGPRRGWIHAPACGRGGEAHGGRRGSPPRDL